MWGIQGLTETNASRVQLRSTSQILVRTRASCALRAQSPPLRLHPFPTVFACQVLFTIFQAILEASAPRVRIPPSSWTASASTVQPTPSPQRAPSTYRPAHAAWGSAGRLKGHASRAHTAPTEALQMISVSCAGTSQTLLRRRQTILMSVSVLLAIGGGGTVQCKEQIAKDAQRTSTSKSLEGKCARSALHTLRCHKALQASSPVFAGQST
jgi:hypothetical protein